MINCNSPLVLLIFRNFAGEAIKSGGWKPRTTMFPIANRIKQRCIVLITLVRLEWDAVAMSPWRGRKMLRSCPGQISMLVIRHSDIGTFAEDISSIYMFCPNGFTYSKGRASSNRTSDDEDRHARFCGDFCNPRKPTSRNTAATLFCRASSLAQRNQVEYEAFLGTFHLPFGP